MTCRYILAKNAADELEYSMALELLEGIPDDFEKTGSLRAKATYQKAKSAMRQKNWASAAELLGSLDREALRQTYRDIETLYLEACTKAGIVPYPDTSESPADNSATPAPAPAEFTPAPVPEASPDPFLVTEDETP